MSFKQKTCNKHLALELGGQNDPAGEEYDSFFTFDDLKKS
jgi:hypothetical protein